MFSAVLYLQNREVRLATSFDVTNGENNLACWGRAVSGPCLGTEAVAVLNIK